MNRVAPLLRFLTALLFLPWAGPVTAQEPASRWTSEQQAVIDAASRGPVGIERDFEGWSDGYHPDWSYWRLGADEIRPKDTHMELVRGVLEDGTRITGFELEPVDVIVRGDVALLRFNARETLEGPDGSSRTVRYASATLFTQEDGRWLVLASNLFYPPNES